MNHDTTDDTSSTPDQIRALATEAWEAGDYPMTALCVAALGELDETEYALGRKDRALVAGLTRGEALARVDEVRRAARVGNGIGLRYAVAEHRDGETLVQGAARIRDWEWVATLEEAQEALEKIAVSKADAAGAPECADEWHALAGEVRGGETRIHYDVWSYTIVCRQDGKVRGVLA